MTTELNNRLRMADGTVCFAERVEIDGCAALEAVRVPCRDVVLVQLFGAVDQGWTRCRGIGQVIEHVGEDVPPGFQMQLLKDRLDCLLGRLVRRKGTPIVITG